MTDPDRGPSRARAATRASDAMAGAYGDDRLPRSVREGLLWALVDLSRGRLVLALSLAVYASTALVGVFGPVSVRAYLLSGTSVANAYIELQPGIITAITIVLAVNQLVLSPEFGALGRQQERLEDVLSHRDDVVDSADVVASPTDPSGFLRTIVDATRSHAHRLGEAVGDGETPGLREQVGVFVDDIEAEIDPVSEALAAERFGRIELFGAALHYDTPHNIHRARELRRTYGGELSLEAERALDDLLDALKLFTISRQYFQTLYLQSEFIRFSRAVLYTGLPALVVAHYSVGVIGPSALPGTTFGVRDLLWFEAATFTVTMLPIVVIVSYVSRIVTLAETNVFISPFSPRDRGP